MSLELDPAFLPTRPPSIPAGALVRSYLRGEAQGSSSSSTGQRSSPFPGTGGPFAPPSGLLARYLPAPKWTRPPPGPEPLSRLLPPPPVWHSCRARSREGGVETPVFLQLSDRPLGLPAPTSCCCLPAPPRPAPPCPSPWPFNLLHQEFSFEALLSPARDVVCGGGEEGEKPSEGSSWHLPWETPGWGTAWLAQGLLLLL